MSTRHYQKYHRYSKKRKSKRHRSQSPSSYRNANDTKSNNKKSKTKGHKSCSIWLPKKDIKNDDHHEQSTDYNKPENIPKKQISRKRKKNHHKQEHNQTSNQYVDYNYNRQKHRDEEYEYDHFGDKHHENKLLVLQMAYLRDQCQEYKDKYDESVQDLQKILKNCKLIESHNMTLQMELKYHHQNQQTENEDIQKISDLKQCNEKLMEEKEELYEQVQEIKSKHDGLKQENLQQNINLNAIKEHCSKLEIECNDLKQKYQELTNSYQQEKSKYNALESICKQLQKNGESLTILHQKVMKENEDKMKKLQESVVIKTNQISALKEYHKSVVNDYKQGIQAMEQQNKGLQETIIQYTNQITILQQNDKSLNQSLQASMNELMTFKMKCNALETEIKLKDLAINEFREQTKNLKETKQGLTDKTKQLIKIHVDTMKERDEYRKKYDEMLIRETYHKWNFTEIVSWIVGLNKNEYQKYADILLESMKIENIDGSSLKHLTRNDLHRFGIKLFKDNNDIFDAIQSLTACTTNTKKNDETKSNTKSKRKNRRNFKKKGNNECVICMDNKPLFACIPCGHQCLCDQCKDNVIDNCPVCRKPYNSVIKIFR